MEVEALEAIYEDDFQKTSEAPPIYDIELTPNPAGEENHVGVTMTCTIPADYPDTVPQVGLSRDRRSGSGMRCSCRLKSA